jgi:sensor domain CHASE-containing protein
MNGASKAGHPTVRYVLISFALVFVISVVFIGGLAVVATRSHDRVAIVDSVHLTKSVLASIERRLTDQLLDYSYWDEAVTNLVTKPNPIWADKNVGIYMHDKFAVTTSFVVGAGNRPVYGMIDGVRSLDDPLRRFTVDLGLLVERTRAQPRSAPPKPVTGLVSDGKSIHIAAASVLTNFPVEGRAKGDIATNSVLIFTRALNAGLLAEIANNYLLKDLRVSRADAPLSGASFPLIGPAGDTLGRLIWRVDSPAGEMLRWLLPLIAVVFLVFAATAYIFHRKTQAVTNTLVENIAAIEASEEALRTSEEKHRTFAADVAHELRTPLALLRTQIDNLGDSETTTDLLQDIDGMSRLVSQLLVATRLDWIAVGPDDRGRFDGHLHDCRQPSGPDCG